MIENMTIFNFAPKTQPDILHREGYRMMKPVRSEMRGMILRGI